LRQESALGERTHQPLTQKIVVFDDQERGGFGRVSH
jgi:hypothetical protein